MRILLFCGAAVAALFANTASAQDAPFTGPRVEAVIGYDHIPVEGEKFEGLLYGGIVGYDYQIGSAVFGVEAEASGSTLKASEEVEDESGELRAGRDLYIGARAGYAVSGEAMLYAKVGYTNARIEATYDDGEDEFEDHATLDGFRVGAGLEYKITPTVHLKTEYRYSNYSNLDDLDIDLDRHQVMAGVGIRF